MNKIPRKFYHMEGRMLVDNPPLRRGDMLVIVKNDFGYLAYDETQHTYYYIKSSLIRDENVFQVQEVVR